MREKNKKKQIAKISVFITSIFVIFMSVTYAFINQTLTGTKEVVINVGVLDLVLEEENAITISNALPMYDAVGMIQEDVFVFRLVNKTSNPTNYVLKMTKIASDNELSPSDVKYYLTKDGVGTPALLSSLPSDGTVDSGTIAGNDTIDYTLRLWIDSNVTDDTAISGKTLSYRIDAEASQEMPKSPSFAEVKLFADENLGTNCKTYDDGTDTFLVGQCSQNYVWYSGKLWRVVLKNNETGAVKMVTDNAITAIPYNEDGNTAFENSYMDQWLNQEFLPTLHDYEDYLVVDSIWDATQTTSSTSRPSYTTQVTRTVGLLNRYEHYTTYNNSYGLATYSTVYLNAEVHWWLMTPTSPSYVRVVTYSGYLNNLDPTYGLGARPSINLQSTIQISGGSGIQSDPYILEGDIQEPINGTTLLNTRYSGEYITFNNELYRIVDIENGLTKITAVDKPSSLSSNAFDSSDNETTNFANASIKTDLETYYQGLKTTNETAYNMIEPSTTWYLGTVGSGENYKASICASIDATKSMNDCEEKVTSTTANIGLPRAGEMFTSQITRGRKYYFWTLTPSSPPRVRDVTNDGYLGGFDPGNGDGARPSMYLKSNVVIASNNTGNGTYEHPYEIELGQ